MKRSQGFSLVELMVTLSIIGILAGIGVPLYADYASKSQVSRVHSELAVYTRAAEPLIAASRGPSIRADPVDALGFVDSTLSTVSFGRFRDAATSTITAVMDGAASAATKGTTIRMQRTDDGLWTCTVIGNGNGFKDRFRPSQCL